MASAFYSNTHKKIACFILIWEYLLYWILTLITICDNLCMCNKYHYKSFKLNIVINKSWNLYITFCIHLAKMAINFSMKQTKDKTRSVQKNTHNVLNFSVGSFWTYFDIALSVRGLCKRTRLRFSCKQKRLVKARDR